jgi:hypothetical protein
MVAAILSAAARPTGLLGRRPPQVRETTEESPKVGQRASRAGNGHVATSEYKEEGGLLQRTADWVSSIRGDEGSGLSAEQQKQRNAAASGQIRPSGWNRRGEENKIASGQGQNPDNRGIGLTQPQGQEPRPPDKDASSTVSFKSCDSPRTAASVESLTADADTGRVGDGGGKRWPSVSRIPQLVSSVTGAASGRKPRGESASKELVVTEKKSMECDNVTALGGFSPSSNARNATIPERGTVCTAGPLDAIFLQAAGAAGGGPRLNALAAIGRPRVRSESPSR